LMLNHPAVNRPVRTRMRGGVGSGGEKPPLTRLGKSAPKTSGKRPKSTALKARATQLILRHGHPREVSIA